MPTDVPKSLSEDEIYLRVTAPSFFEELVASRTATLIEQGDPEAYTAWKEVRLQSNQELQSLPDAVKSAIDQQRRQKSFEMQSLDFAASLTRFAADQELPLEKYNLTPEQAVRNYASILREEQEQERVPAEDMRFVAAREIDAANERHRENSEPVRHTFKGMSRAAKDEFLAEQRQVGKTALKAQENSLQQTSERTKEVPEKDR